MVADKLLHRLAPANEPRDLWEFQPSEGDGNDGLVGIMLSGRGWEALELRHVSPATQKLQAYVPSLRQRPTKRGFRKKRVDCILALPRGEHRQSPQLHARRRKDRRSECHHRHALRVIEPRRLRPTQERTDGRGEARRREMKRMDRHGPKVARRTAAQRYARRMKVIDHALALELYDYRPLIDFMEARHKLAPGTSR